jgi:hypothetical protein
MIREIKKRARSGELLSLKKHRRSRSEQHQGRQRPITTGSGEPVKA